MSVSEREVRAFLRGDLQQPSERVTEDDVRAYLSSSAPSDEPEGPGLLQRAVGGVRSLFGARTEGGMGLGVREAQETAQRRSIEERTGREIARDFFGPEVDVSEGETAEVTLTRPGTPVPEPTPILETRGQRLTDRAAPAQPSTAIARPEEPPGPSVRSLPGEAPAARSGLDFVSDVNAMTRGASERVARGAAGRLPARGIGEDAPELRRADPEALQRTEQARAMEGHRQADVRELEQRLAGAPPGVEAAARLARGFERAPLAGAPLRMLRSAVDKLQDGDRQSAEQILDDLPPGASGRILELAGEFGGIGLEIATVSRLAGAAGQTAPLRERAVGQALQKLDPNVPVSLREAAVAEAVAGIPTDIGYTVREGDVLSLPIGVTAGATLGPLFRKMPSGNSGFGEIVDILTRREAREPEAISRVLRRGEEAVEEAPRARAPEEPQPTLRRRLADVIDPSRETELEQAFRDPMTGLPNQTAFRRAQPRLDADPGVEIAALDVQNLKAINDIEGSDVADEFLGEVGRIAREVAEERGLDPRDVFRAGGDEFAVAGPPGEAEAVAREIAERIGTRRVAQSEFSTGIRVGVGDTWHEADAAAQAAKKAEEGARMRDRPAGVRAGPFVEVDEDGFLRWADVRTGEAVFEQALSHPAQPLRPQASEGLPAAGAFREAGQEVAEIESPQQIVEKLADALSIKVAVGKMGAGVGRGALGIFKRQPEVIRLRDISDVETMGHEVGHYLQKVLFGVSGSDPQDILEKPLRELPGALRGEIEDMAQGISDESLSEGWAEFWRRYVANPEALERDAPSLTRWADERLESMPTLRNTLLEAREQWRLVREASPHARVQSRISVGDRPRSFSIRDGFSRLRTNLIDDLEPVRQVVEAVTGGKGVETIRENAEKLARLVRGAVGTGDHFLERGALDFTTLTRVGPSLREILEPVADLDGFRRYMVSRRAVELHGRDINPGVRLEDAQAVVADLDAKFGETYRVAFDALQEYQDNLLRYLVDAGVISNDSYRAIKDLNKNYVPFYRVFDEEGGVPGFGQRFGHLFSPVKRIKGSGRDIIDPLESIAKNTYLYTHLASKQQVSNALALLARREGAGAAIEGVMQPVQPVKFRLGEVRRQLDEIAGEDVVDELFAAMAGGGDEAAEELLMIFRPGDYLSKPNMISVLQEGRRQWYEVAPPLYEALQGLNRESLDAWVRWMSKPAGWLRAGATLAPEFQLRNPFRDQIMAFIQSEYGYRPFVDLAAGMFEIFRKGDVYWQWKAGGGSRAALVDMDRRGMQTKVEELLRSPVRNVIKDPLEPLRALSALMEDGTRVGQYRRGAIEEARRLGVEISDLPKDVRLELSASAREVSIDFNRHGAKTTAIRHMAAFWNARLQGYDRLYRAIRTQPKKFSATVFSAITLPSLLEYYANRDDPEYHELPQWQRDLFWMVKVRGEWLRFPKPFELGLIFGTLPIRVIEWMDAEDPDGVDQFFRETLVDEAKGFFPMPTSLVPLFENTFNYSLFLERPIVPRSQEDVRPEFQGTGGTSEVAKMLGRWGGISPPKIDNLLYGWSGGLGRLGVETADRIIRSVEDLPSEPDRGIGDIPGVRGLTARRPGFSSESVERFYREYEDARKAAGTLRHLERENDAEAIQLLYQDPEFVRDLQRVQGYRRVSNQLAGLRAQSRIIERDPDMRPEEKRERIEELGKTAMEIARAAIGREVPR